MERQTIKIDESKCTGCGTCASACAEGVIAVIDGVARVVNQDHCDGLGVCVGQCPNGAISLVTVEAPARGCALWSLTLETAPAGDAGAADALAPQRQTATRNWPIKLRLVPVGAWLRGADVAIWADCTGFALMAGASDRTKDRAMLVGCPKFDDRKLYVEKLVEIFRTADLRSVHVYHMSMSCCSGLVGLVKQAQDIAGTNVPVTAFEVQLNGTIADGRQV
ncbi:MAG: 4Fe-4S binding protein [Bacillota bacterium]|jgi:ferredoxin|nr:4Fe-4S binding protein [Bacillota bacterium]